jgi:hypothetical protein
MEEEEKESMTFHGDVYQESTDKVRLSKQLIRVRDAMLDGQWRTFSDISEITGDPEPSISAQLRHLRRPCFGAYAVDKRKMASGLWQYRVTEGAAMPPFQLNTTERRLAWI